MWLEWMRKSIWYTESLERTCDDAGTRIEEDTRRYVLHLTLANAGFVIRQTTSVVVLHASALDAPCSSANWRTKQLGHFEAPRGDDTLLILDLI
jgi:hypothetical protein